MPALSNSSLNILHSAEISVNLMLEHIGIKLKDVWVALSDQLSLPGEKCVYVSAITPGSLAFKSGLKWGDIIIRINDFDTLTILDVFNAIDSIQQDELVSFKIRRVCETFDLVFKFSK